MIDCLEQLKKAYEVEKMSLEEIVEDQGLTIESVKAGLMQCSSLYRKECKVEEKEDDTFEDADCNFSRDQLKSVTQEIYNLAMGAEDEHLKLKALTFIRNDAKGRLNPVKNIQQGGINILTINNAILQARERKQKQLINV